MFWANQPDMGNIIDPFVTTDGIQFSCCLVMLERTINSLTTFYEILSDF